MKIPLLFVAALTLVQCSIIEVKVQGCDFDVLLNSQIWFPSGPVFIYSNGQEATNVTCKAQPPKSGHDARLGEFQQFETSWVIDNVPQLTRSISHYVERGTLSFSVKFNQEVKGASVNDKDKVSVSLTSFWLNSTERLGYVSWANNMAADKWAHFGEWDSNTEGIQGGISGSLIMVYDSNARTSVMISAASNMMAANMEAVKSGDNPTLLRLGVMGAVDTIPAGYEISWILSASNYGPVATMKNWGNFLLDKHGKDTSARDDDYTLKYLGYSTDNGAYYYYHVENITGRWTSPQNFEPTQLGIKAYADHMKIPYKYILLDSWWYPKDETGAVTTWTAMPQVYPNGLYNIYNKTSLPVQGHNRYWSPHTPYATQNGGQYNFILEPENHLSIPNDQKFWDDLLRNSSKWGLITYEQDWLHNEFEGLNATLTSPTLGREWLMQMGRAASNNKLTIQYCMSYPRFLIQSTEIPSVTNFRASDDYHPGNEQYQLGLSSSLANALGLAPSKDNYWSTTIQSGSSYGPDAKEPYSELESAISSLTGGPVAPSDKIGHSDTKLIMRACNEDGLLLKPSVPAMSIDSTYRFRSFRQNGPDGEVYSGYTQLGTTRFHHVIAAELASEYKLLLVDLHHPTPLTDPISVVKRVDSTSWVWFEDNHGAIPQSLSTFSSQDAIVVPPCGKDDFHLYRIFPVLSNGWVLLGELAKWVPVSNQRIVSMSIIDTGLQLNLNGAANESVSIYYTIPPIASSNSHAFSVKHVDCKLSAYGSARIELDRDSEGKVKSTCIPF